MITISDLQIGFCSQESEINEVVLPIDGTVPIWLGGSLLRTNPSKFEIANKPLNHWFDGLAMLHKFSIKNQKINYTSKFLHSEAYNKATQTSALSSREFGTDPQISALDRLTSIFKVQLTDNANVNISQIANKFVAMTETPSPVMFDPTSLNTIGKMKFADQLSVHLSTAHPHFDFSSQYLYNIAIHFSAKSKYYIFRIKKGSNVREIVATINVTDPGYIHSFGMSQRYIILVEFPFLVHPLELLFSGKPYIENYHWNPQKPTRFYVIDKEGTNAVSIFESSACFSFHHVNSYEQGKSLVVDLLAYPDSSIVQALYLNNLRSNNVSIPAPTLQRFHLNLNNQTLKQEQLCNLSMELPRLNYAQFNTKIHRFLYAVAYNTESKFLQDLVRVDLKLNETSVWHEDHCFAGEPVFVPNPQSNSEDSGILLSVVLNCRQQKSFLLGLDASTMAPIFKASMPNIIPFGFHGQFMEV